MYSFSNAPTSFLYAWIYEFLSLYIFPYFCNISLKEKFIYSFSNLYTQRGSWTHDPEIKSHILFQLSQVGTLEDKIFADGIKLRWSWTGLSWALLQWLESIYEEGDLDTEHTGENTTWRIRQRLEWYTQKPRNTKKHR